MRRPARREVARRVRRVTAADRVVQLAVVIVDRVVQLAVVTVDRVVQLAVVTVAATGGRRGIADRVRPAEIVTIEIDRHARH
jgi:hypothetical protein